MIYPIPNADVELKRLISIETTKQIYLSTCERYRQGNLFSFITDMQILVTKLGIMISDVAAGPDISYCIQSIRYLCGEVLDDPKLEKAFIGLDLNNKGNDAKHSLSADVSIDMERCVEIYNFVVARIVKQYGLDSLRAMIITKEPEKEAPLTSGQSFLRLMHDFDEIEKKRPSSGTLFDYFEGRYQVAEGEIVGGASDDDIYLLVALVKGVGQYTRGLFIKKQRINFDLRVEIENQGDLKVVEVYALVKGKEAQKKVKLPYTLESTTEFDLPVEKFGDKVTVTVVVKYKLGLRYSKEIKVTLEKDF